eukprot:2570636-Ditylum_brightwellii.AAC.1
MTVDLQSLSHQATLAYAGCPEIHIDPVQYPGGGILPHRAVLVVQSALSLYSAALVAWSLWLCPLLSLCRSKFPWDRVVCVGH